MSTAAEIMATARSWRGVPFRHQGRSRNGVDCAGVVRAVGLQHGEVIEDVNGYARQPDGSMRAACDRYLDPVPAPVLGGVLLMRFVSQPQHLAIVVDYGEGGLGIVHALEKSGQVVEHQLDRLWRSRIVQCYRFRGMVG